MLRSNGTPLFIRLNILFKPEANDKPIYLLTITDISSFKKAHAELRISAAAFETEKGILVADHQRKILRVNSAYTRITVYQANEVKDHPPTFLCPYKLNNGFDQSFWESVLNEGYWQGEVREKRKNGKTYPAWVTLTAVSGETPKDRSGGDLEHPAGETIA